MSSVVADVLSPQPAYAFTTTCWKVARGFAVTRQGRFSGEQAGKWVRLPDLTEGYSMSGRMSKNRRRILCGQLVQPARSNRRCSRGNDCPRPCCKRGLRKLCRGGATAPKTPGIRLPYHLQERHGFTAPLLGAIAAEDGDCDVEQEEGHPAFFTTRGHWSTVCHCFAEAVPGVTRCSGTAYAKQWHTAARNAGHRFDVRPAETAA